MDRAKRQPYYELNSGYRIPAVGLGVGGKHTAAEFARAASEIGYRCFDTASLYGTEP